MGSSLSSAFIYLDGDDVGAHIELHLLRDEVEAAAALSTSVVRAIGDIADEIRTNIGGQIIFAAGDEVLCVIPTRQTVEVVERMRLMFRAATGLTISCGIGETAAEAARHLHLAKLLGKDRRYGSVDA